MTNPRRSSANLKIPSSLPPDPLVRDSLGRLCRYVATVEVNLDEVGIEAAAKRMAERGSTEVRYMPSRRAGLVRECHYRALV